MFFNYDILFKNGPLALLWIAGNENLKSKKGRSRKEFGTLIRADITVMCDSLRKLLPQMGKADGIPLRKMAILVKGIGVIYEIQIEEFAKEVNKAWNLLKRPIVLRNNLLVDQPVRKKARGSAKELDLLAVNEPLQLPFNDEDINYFDFGNNDVFSISGSPRHCGNYISENLDGAEPFHRVQRTPSPNVEGFVEFRTARPQKRLRFDSEVENADDIFRRLGGRAHCLPDDNAILLPQPNQEFVGDLDMGNGADMLQGVFHDPVDIQPCIEDEITAAEQMPQTAQEEDGFVIPSRLETTIIGNETRPENFRSRRNQNDRDPDSTVLELPELSNGHQKQRRGKRAKRRLLLQVDEETSLPAKDLIERANAIRSGIDSEALFAKVVDSRAPPKSLWKFKALALKPTIDVITYSGRPGGSSVLNKMILDGLERQKKMETRSNRVADSTAGVPGISDAMLLEEDPLEQNSQMRDVTKNITTGMMSTVAGGVEQSNIAFPPGEIEHEPEVGYTVFDREQIPEPASEEIMDPFQMPDERHRGQRSERKINERSVTREHLEGCQTFEELYPHGGSKKRQAARAFMLMLKMQAKEKIELHQEDMWGEIQIQKHQK